MTDVSSPPLYASMTLGLVDVDMLLFVQVMKDVLDPGCSMPEYWCVGVVWIAREGTGIKDVMLKCRQSNK